MWYPIVGFVCFLVTLTACAIHDKKDRNRFYPNEIGFANALFAALIVGILWIFAVPVFLVIYLLHMLYEFFAN